jgi:hypothetical protein
MVPQFKKEMQKNLATHMSDEEGYRRHLSTFKKAFLDFMYRSLDNSKPFTSQSWDPFVLVLFKCFHNTFTRCPRFSALFV